MPLGLIEPYPESHNPFVLCCGFGGLYDLRQIGRQRDAVRHDRLIQDTTCAVANRQYSDIKIWISR